MRIRFPDRNDQAAHTLMVTIAVVILVGIALAAFMRLSISQNQLTMRSQVWNACMPIVEAGLEEALSHAETNYRTNMVSNGWNLFNNAYIKSNTIGEGFYLTAISVTLPYRIVTRGYLPMPGSQEYISRTVRVTTQPQGLFFGALVVRDSIKLNGNNILTDSYDSRDELKSTGGLYDAAKAGDKGDVGSVTGLLDAFNIGNANIHGKAFTGPGAGVQVGSNGAVGSRPWHLNGNTGIEPGWWQNDFNMDLPDVEPPFASGAPPSSGLVNGTNYNYILGTGDYESTGLSGKVLVTGDATLYVKGEVDFKSGDQLVIAPGAMLKLYVAGERTKIGEVINGTGVAGSFMYYGLPTNLRVDIVGENKLTAALYAPNADVTFGGESQFFGSVVGRTATLNGSSSFHYDEALLDIGPRRNVVVETWDEI